MSRPMIRMPRLIARRSGATPFHLYKSIGYVWQANIFEVILAVSEV
jgi:hypothetical protein